MGRQSAQLNGNAYEHTGKGMRVAIERLEALNEKRHTQFALYRGFKSGRRKACWNEDRYHSLHLNLFMQTADDKQGLNVVIVDDEERAGDALRLMLEKFVPRIAKISVCADARQAVDVIKQEQPQIVFLDIKMPHLSGFDVLQQIPQQPFKVIFTTAFNEFAIKAIRFSAFDYLLKPVDVEELIATVNRFLETQEAETAQQAALLKICCATCRKHQPISGWPFQIKKGCIFTAFGNYLFRRR